MARKQMITRTIKATEVTALTANVFDRTTEEVTVKLEGEYKTNDDILKILKKRFDTDETKYVAIIATNVSETLYGMGIDTFMENAKVMPPR